MAARTLATGVSLFAVICAAHANNFKVKGSESSAFQAAIEVWLNDNDRESLPELARLGRDGNEAARQFLWVLNFRGDLSTGWPESLPSRERRGFFKPKLPGSPAFGGWWAKDKRPLLVRMMLTDQLVPDNTPNNIALINLGEPRLAYARLSPILHYKTVAEIHSIGMSDGLPEPLKFFHYWATDVISDDFSGYSESKITNLTEINPLIQHSLLLNHALVFGLVTADRQKIDRSTVLLLASKAKSQSPALPLVEGDLRYIQQQKREGTGWSGGLKSTVDWLKETPLAEHHRLNCQESCPNETEACLLTSYLASGGFSNLYGHETVSERLVSSARFRSSVRGKILPARQIAWRVHHARMPLDRFLIDLEDASSCFAAQVDDEVVRIKTLLKN